MFSSLFPACPPHLWPTPAGYAIWTTHYNAAHTEARRLVPPERRLEYSVEQGWGPLCEFLEVGVPVVEGEGGKGVRAFPMVNDTGSFTRKMQVVKRRAWGRVVRRCGVVVGAVGVVGWGVWWIRR